VGNGEIIKKPSLKGSGEKRIYPRQSGKNGHRRISSTDWFIKIGTKEVTPGRTNLGFAEGVAGRRVPAREENRYMTIAHSMEGPPREGGLFARAGQNAGLRLLELYRTEPTLEAGERATQVCKNKKRRAGTPNENLMEGPKEQNVPGKPG